MITSANGIELYYEEIGSGPPLLLIAGFGLDHSCWDALAPLLARISHTHGKDHPHPSDHLSDIAHHQYLADIGSSRHQKSDQTGCGHLSRECEKYGLANTYRVIAFDNRGVGQSTTPDAPYSIETMADDTIALLDGLGIESCHIVGHSMGAAIAQTVAATCPDRVDRLVLYSGFTLLSPVARFVQQTLRTLFEQNYPREMLFELVLPWVFGPSLLVDEKQLDLVRKSFTENPYPQPLHGYTRQMEALMAFDSTGFLSKITAPTLILQGERDLLHLPDEAESLRKNIPQATVKLMPNMGHNVPPFETALLAEAINQFIAG